MKDKLIKALREANLYSHEATRGAPFAFDFITDQVTKMPLDKALDWLCEGYEKRLREDGLLGDTYTTPADALSNPPFEEEGGTDD